MSESVAMLLGVIVGAIVGVIAVLFAGKGKATVERQLREQAEQSLRGQLETLRAESERWRREAETRQVQESQLGSQLAQQATLAAERGSAVGQLQTQLHEVRQQLTTVRETERDQAAQIQGLTTTVEKERENAQEKLKILADARAELTHQFEALAGKIFDEKSTKFTEQNKTNLDQLLNPLRVQIQDFRGKVEEAQKDSNQTRFELRGKLESLEAQSATLGRGTQSDDGTARLVEDAGRLGRVHSARPAGAGRAA
jgi:DNA recombination protein RmuC